MDSSLVTAGAFDADDRGGPPTRTAWAEKLLRGEILTGALEPGERLKIGDLIERHPGLSPTPLREALSRLAGAGLVEVLPNRGMRVAEGSYEELLDVHENRARLETLAFLRTMEAADQRWHAEVERALEALVRQSGVVSASDPVGPSELIEWEDAHRRFHFALISRCGSPWLLRLVGIVYEQTVRYRYLTIRAHPAFEEIAEAHREVFAAATSGDEEHALKVLEDHLMLTVRSAEQLPAEEFGLRRSTDAP